jgi:hypothetical protein
MKLRYKWALPLLTIINICVGCNIHYLPFKDPLRHFNCSLYSVICMRKQREFWTNEQVKRDSVSLVRETSRLHIKLHSVSFSVTWNVCHHKFVYVLTHIISQIMETSNRITSDKQKCSCAFWHMTLICSV